jgi:tetratricopeptide (TPR) repeat protein
MRSADLRLPATCLAAAALLALAGCDSIGFRAKPAAAPVPAASASAPGAAASAPGDAAGAVVVAEVTPAAQRAFDDALAALKAGRDAEARTRLQALAKSDPELAGPHANLGLIARHAGRMDEAVAELERATALDPRQPVMWNQLGITYRQDGQFAKARAAYEHAIALDPDYATAIVNLGVLEDLYLGEPAQALALYTRYLALTPAGDPLVAKWVADLRNRLPKPAAAAAPASSAASAAGKESS